MGRVSRLKRDHEEIFKSLLDFEEEINQDFFDHSNLIYLFNKIVNLLLYHKENHKSFLKSVGEFQEVKSHLDQASMDPRTIRGHAIVIGNAIASKDLVNIKISLENDGRMFISKIKEHILEEEIILDKLLFLGILPPETVSSSQEIQ